MNINHIFIINSVSKLCLLPYHNCLYSFTFCVCVCLFLVFLFVLLLRNLINSSLNLLCFFFSFMHIHPEGGKRSKATQREGRRKAVCLSCRKKQKYLNDGNEIKKTAKKRKSILLILSTYINIKYTYFLCATQPQDAVFVFIIYSFALNSNTHSHTNSQLNPTYQLIAQQFLFNRMQSNSKCKYKNNIIFYL